MTELEERSVYNEFRNICKYDIKSHIYFPDERKEYTYQEFLIVVDHISACLDKLKIGYGDKVAICGDSTSEWMGLLFAINKLGGIVVPINGQSSKQELQYILEKSEAKLLFYIGRTDEKFFNEIKTAHLEKTIFIGCSERRIAINEMRWEEFINVTEDSKIYACEVNEDYSIQFTSGTTSNPKGAVIKQKAVLRAAEIYGKTVKLSENENILMPIPLYYCFGNILVALSFFMYRSSLIVMRRFSVQKSLKYLEKYQCTLVCGVPTMYFAMMSATFFKNYDMKCLNKIIIGGSFCSSEEAKKISIEFGTSNIIIGYGLTEATTLSMISSFEDTFENRINSVGKVIDGVKAKIVALDSGKEVSKGESGELLLKGWSLMKEYYGQPIETASVIDSSGWLHTGDVAVECNDGFYKITGRIKDIIIRGGENISPSEIESSLVLYPGIKGAQVVGVSDSIMGERIAVFIITENSELLNIGDIVSYLEGILPKYKIPEFFISVDKFPMTASGKIRKYLLKSKAEKMKQMKTYEWIIAEVL